MPDISMCANYNCPLKDKCYRYLAIPTDGYQSYANFEPSRGIECYWDASGRKIDSLKKADERNARLFNNWKNKGENNGV